jgi:hypothetical protein
MKFSLLLYMDNLERVDESTTAKPGDPPAGFVERNARLCNLRFSMGSINPIMFNETARPSKQHQLRPQSG